MPSKRHIVIIHSNQIQYVTLFKTIQQFHVAVLSKTVCEMSGLIYEGILQTKYFNQKIRPFLWLSLLVIWLILYSYNNIEK